MEVSVNFPPCSSFLQGYVWYVYMVMYGVYTFYSIINYVLNISHLPQPQVGTEPEAENPGLHNPVVITDAIMQ